MPADFLTVRRVFWLLYLIYCGIALPVLIYGQPVVASSQAISSGEAEGLVREALAREAQATRDTSHPMRFVLRKSSPRVTTTKDIFETHDGAVARLTLVNDKPLSPEAEQQEQARLDELLTDPSRQRHRKQSEDDDTARALKILRALPSAFLYEYTGTAESASGLTGGAPEQIVEKFTFRPNPSFVPPSLETQILTAMTGTIWIAAAAQRVVRLEGHLQQDVDFGWGILGQLNKGGWIVIEQADVGDGQWRIVRFQMAMNGRVVFKARSFDTVEEQSGFTPVPIGLSYRQAVQILRANP